MARVRELWFVAPGRVELRPAGPPTPLGARQVRARALCSGVSQGTELLLYRGEGPDPFDPSLDAPGTPTFPRRYGYAWVGEVVEEGTAVSGWRQRRVFALAPHGDEHVLDEASLRALPDAVPSARAVLAATLETALTIVWDAAPAIGDEIVVLGGGTVGLLAAWLARRAGAEVLLVEPGERRREAARRLGIERAESPGPRPAADADIVIEATGDPAVLDAAIAHARPEATVVIASFYGARRAAVALGAHAHRARLTLRSSQVSAIPPRLAPRWTIARRSELVARLLAQPELDALLEPAVAIDEAPALYARLDRAPAETLQASFVYPR